MRLSRRILFLMNISCQEFMTICPNLSDDQVKMAFSKFDTSGDDKLDYREFCEMIRQKVAEDFNLYKPGKLEPKPNLFLALTKMSNMML